MTFPTYRRTQPKTFSVGSEIVIIAKAARVAELVALATLHIVVPSPQMEIAKAIHDATRVSRNAVIQVQVDIQI